MLNSRWFLFLSRAAFIANFFFLLFVIFSKTSFVLPQVLVGIILSIGFVLSPILNFSVNFWLVLLLVKGIKNPAPVFIIGFNLFWLIFQFFYFIFI